jgi:rhodanese-related sulfurtransferase
MIKEISAVEAFNKIQNENAILIDVRTDAEFAFVGMVDLSSFNKEAICLPWKIFPSMNLNPRFQMMLEKALTQICPEPKKAELIFMCRSGARSFEAARFMAESGYENCYNLTFGFEGEADQNGHRGNINGWKACNLPWRQ